MNRRLKLLDVVAVLENVPKHGLRRGEVGTLVESLAPDVWLVEFSDNHGEEYAIAELMSEQLIRLHYRPSPRRRRRVSAEPVPA